MAILAIVLGLGAPAMGTYLQNSKLASVTASFYAGVQAARTEAIRRNIQSQFVLTDLPLARPAWPMTPAWPLPTVAAGSCDPCCLRRHSFLEPSKPSTRSRRTKAKAASVAPSIVVNCALPGGCTGAIPFNGFGGTADNQPYRINISNPAGRRLRPGRAGSLSPASRCRRAGRSPPAISTIPWARRQPCVPVLSRRRAEAVRPASS